MFLAAKYVRKKYKERQQRNGEGAMELGQRLPGSHEVNNAEPFTTNNSPRPFQTATPKPNSRQEYNRLDEQSLSRPDVNRPQRDSYDPEKETPQETAEKKRRRIYRYKIIFGLFMPFTLQALDTTIIASALPFIANDFGTPLSPRAAAGSYTPEPIAVTDRAQVKSASSTGSSPPST
jgi:hypothetical protein